MLPLDQLEHPCKSAVKFPLFLSSNNNIVSVEGTQGRWWHGRKEGMEWLNGGGEERGREEHGEQYMRKRRREGARERG